MRREKKIENFDILYPSEHVEKINNYFLTSNSDNKYISDKIHKLECVFFICFTNRCGSNYISQTIASSGVLPQSGEYLNYDTVIENSKKNSLETFADYFHWLIDHATYNDKYFGCKISFEQLLYIYNNFS